jgi:RNA polymerase sigma factor (TIGR02999 family)
MAGQLLRREGCSHPPQATALINEAYVRLVHGDEAPCHMRARFQAVAARALRAVLVEHARQQRTVRGDDRGRITLAEVAALYEDPATDILAVDEALERLGENDERLAQIVELRYFGGLCNRETAEALGLSPATIEREWRAARAWIMVELGL